MTLHSPDDGGIARAIQETSEDGWWEEKVDWWPVVYQFKPEDVFLIAIARVAREDPSMFGQQNLDIINEKLEELRARIVTT